MNPHRSLPPCLAPGCCRSRTPRFGFSSRPSVVVGGAADAAAGAARSSCRSAATSMCCRAPAPTSPSPSAGTASSWSIRGLATMTEQVLAAIRRLQQQLDLRDQALGWRRRDAIERRRSQHRESAQADPLHHQHARASRSRGRERAAAPLGHDVHRRQRRGQHRRRERRRRDHGARERCWRG